MSGARDEFYIGWAPAPPGLRRFARLTVLGLFVLAGGMAALLATGQRRPAAARFEYGQPRAWRGRLSLRPAPVLWTSQTDALLLVAPGKHGAGELLADLDGRAVELEGTLIERPGLLAPQRMLEVEARSAHTIPATLAGAPPAVALGTVRWRGEIVDGKCYLGVMVPGEGKPHRDCAARCLAGGTPALLALADGRGGATTVLLATRDGQALGPRLADLAAEPVLVSGELERQGGLFVLYTAPDRIDRIDRIVRIVRIDHVDAGGRGGGTGHDHD